jgi:hypothetical protein
MALHEPRASTSRYPSPTSRRAIGILGGVVLLFAALILATNFMFGWAYMKRLSGDYALVAVDIHEQMNVSRLLPSGDAVGVIRATVFAVGWNHDFIIAQQHEPSYNGYLNSLVTNFYILRTANGELYGPLTLEEFNAERVNQGVPDGLTFTLFFRDLQ